LPRFQIEASQDLNYRVCYPRPSFDAQSIAWDLNYFKYYFLRLAGIPFNEQELQKDFSRLTRFLLTAGRDYFLYRDFQSRNVMLRHGQPFFLDYQGGRKGALHYDIASLLYDAKADLPPAVRQHLLEHYFTALARFIKLTPDEFMRHYYAFVYIRIMQALGAYGFRGFFERKPHFLQSVPFALKNLRWLLEHIKLPIALPMLLGAFEQMIESDKLRHLITTFPVGQAILSPAGLTLQADHRRARERHLASHIRRREGSLCSGKARQAPAREILVAAINRIGEHALHGMGTDGAEEFLSGRPGEAGGFAVLKS